MDADGTPGEGQMGLDENVVSGLWSEMEQIQRPSLYRMPHKRTENEFPLLTE